MEEPKNLWIKIGTTVSELVSDGVLRFKEDVKKIVFGGPMMGLSVDSMDYPIIKGTSGVLFLSRQDIDLRKEENCIRCARCVDVCPAQLMPLEYVKLVKNNMYKDLEDFYITDCIECGNCSFVCPAKIPIVNYVKLGKEKLRRLKR